MAIPVAQKLIDTARGGVRLNAKDRRYCVAFLIGTQGDLTNNEMGDLFQVSERQIRLDKKFIREEKSRLIKEEDIGLVIADIAMSLERQIHDVECSKRKCKMGTGTYVEHCKTIHDLQLKTVKALQDLGHYPKNLGTLSIDKYEYKASVICDTTLTPRPMNLEITDGLSKEEPAELEEIPYAEFVDIEAETVDAETIS